MAPLTPLALDPLDDRPLVSVVVSNYNYGRFLVEALESVFAQTYTHLEAIVVDDGSTDDSRAILAELAARDERVVVLHKEQGGQASAWNVALEHARGSIVAFLDPDDRFLPDKIERVVEAFSRRDRAGVVWHRYQPTTADGDVAGLPFPRTITSGWLADRSLASGGDGPGVVTSALACRREVAEAVFPLPDELRRGFGDAYLQACARFLVPSIGLSEALTHYRIHGENDTGAFIPTAATARVRIDALHQVFSLVQAFVARRHGSEIAARLRLEDNPSYWHHLSALYVMSGKPTDGVDGYGARDLLGHLPDTPRKLVWRGLFLLPPSLADRALRLWWRQAAWKRFTRPITSWLRIG